MSESDKVALILTLNEDPSNRVARHALADWYEENGMSDRANFHRFLLSEGMHPVWYETYSKKAGWCWFAFKRSNHMSCEQDPWWPAALIISPAFFSPHSGFFHPTPRAAEDWLFARLTPEIMERIVAGRAATRRRAVVPFDWSKP